MPKLFYTEKDIEDLYQKGTRSLQITDEVVLTELAYEKARQLGFDLITDRADTPPAAPVRPYLSEASTPRVKPTVTPVAPAMTQPGRSAPARDVNVLPVEQRIRSAVIAKLGDQVDAKLLNNIIHRVVKGMGLK
jgi:hypothetical protein